MLPTSLFLSCCVFVLSTCRVPPHRCDGMLHQQNQLPGAWWGIFNKNWRTATHRVPSAPADQIKGSPIHPLEESCLGFCVIPFFHQLDRCSWRCVDPDAKNAAFLVAQSARLLSRCAYLLSPCILSRPSCPAWLGVMCCCLNCVFECWFSHN